MRIAKHTIGSVVFQGDVCLIPVAALPSEAKAVTAINGRHTVTHSETGHDHVVMERPGVQMFQDQMDIMRGWLVIENEPAMLEHLRSTDTHETISFEPGVWEIRRQQEHGLQGWQRATD